MIYVVQAGSGGPCKIGATVEIRKRLATLRVAHYEPLTLLHTFHGGRKEEQELHARFAEYALRNEWFEPVRAIIDGDFGLLRMDAKTLRELSEARPRDANLLALFASAGGPAAVANALGVHVSALYQWKSIPARHVRIVAELAGKQPQEVRPDLWFAA